MRRLAAAWLLACAAHAATFTTHTVPAAPWTRLLGSLGLTAGKLDDSSAVVVIGPDDAQALESLYAKHIVIIEGYGAAAHSLGFELRPDKISVRNLVDVHAPGTAILWAAAEEVSSVQAPAGFQIFATEKWSGAPLIAGKRTGSGAVLWIATSPGPMGMERYPYLLHAAVDLGLELPARTASLWAFFDSAYRIRADSDYLAKRWRSSGISVLHVAAWHNMEPDAQQDNYLARLIEACHRNGILVYAWLELPHVSEKFWADHPAWREKTALGQDAQLDWRKLMNLANAECRQAVQEEIGALLTRFDWDGVNLAELYFESLEGASNPARFTPMNDTIRAEFQRQSGFDPKLLFDANSDFAAGKHPQALRDFLNYRASLTARMQTDWLTALDRQRHAKPYLDVVLTHIDDRFEPGIRDALGADVARTLPALQKRRETLLVEDPATLWSLGPDRYQKLAGKYAELTATRDIAIDINVVERYQDVYPTKKQTGVELMELVHQAATSFRRVALYFENSLEKQDLDLLPVAASIAKVERTAVDEWSIESADNTRVTWRGPAELDGKPWPVQDAGSVLVPPGKHRLSTGFEVPVVTITDFNGEIKTVAGTRSQIDLAYVSRSRALANVRGALERIEVDGASMPLPSCYEGATSLLLPAGQHLVTLVAKQP